MHIPTSMQQQLVNRFVYVDILEAFQCFVFVVQLRMGAGCGRVVQMVERCESFFGKVWEVFG